MTSMQHRSDAAYQTALNRIIHNAGAVLDYGKRSKMTDAELLADLENRVKSIGKVSPATVAAWLTRQFTESARAWERGSNSGDNATLARCEEISEAKAATAERVLLLWSITVDYPGLYPTYKINGHWRYDALSAMREAVAV